MERNEIFANALTDMRLGQKAALRAALWFGFGYHLALQGDATGGADYLKALRAVIKAEGKAKSEATERAKQAKVIGEAMQAKFSAELVTTYATDAHRVQAMLIAAQASGVTSIKSMLDWVQYGDAAWSIREDERKDAEKAEKKAQEAAAGADVADAISRMQVSPLSLDDVPEAVQNLNHEPVAKFDPRDMVVGLSDDDLAWLIVAATGERDRRLEAVKAA